MASMTMTEPTTLFFGAVNEYDFSQLAEDGRGIITGLKIFRAGTFNDSRGRRATWTDQHLQDMVQNFNLLRSRHIFENVPARSDHTESVKDIGAYICALRTDGKFLYADLDVTEPEFGLKLKRKTFRSRSAEIGAYEDNDQNTYFPVLRGLAFVDIGAVEGLHSAERQTAQSFIVDEENAPMGDASEFRIGGRKVTDPAEVQAHIATLEARPGPATFRIGGEDTQDLDAVQRHIESLETFQTEQFSAARESFVDSLIKANFVAATKKDDVLELVKTMSPDQFAAYKSSYEGAPGMTLFAKHGSADNRGASGPADNEDEQATRIEDLEQIVSNHRKAGMADDEIEKTSSYRELATMKASR